MTSRALQFEITKHAKAYLTVNGNFVPGHSVMADPLF